MKKNKNLVRVSIVASLLITTSSILGQNVEVMASNPTNYKDMMEYAAYENVIADAGAIASRIGVRLTPSFAASCSSISRSPGFNSPFKIASLNVLNTTSLSGRYASIFNVKSSVIFDTMPFYLRALL